MKPLMRRDERESSVDHAGDRLAYLVLSYGLLAIVAYRSFADGAASWDLLGLVVLGGLVGTLYRLAHRAVSREWSIVAVGTAGAALVVAAIVAFARRAQDDRAGLRITSSLIRQGGTAVLRAPWTRSPSTARLAETDPGADLTEGLTGRQGAT